MKLKVKRVTVFFYLICFCIFIGATNQCFTIPALLATIVFSMLVVGANDGIASNNIPLGIVLLLAMQNLCIGLGAHWFGNTANSLKLLTQIPFLTICVIWFFLCFTKSIELRYKNDVARNWFCVLILCIVLACCQGFGGFQAAAVMIRNLTVFYMAYSIGRESIKGQKSIDQYIKFIVWLAIIISVVGIIISFGGYELYRHLGIHEVYIAKAAPFAEGNLDGRFYTALISKVLIRMGSIYYEPVNLAYFFALAVICCVFNNPWKKTWQKMGSTILVALGLFLTFGKGGYLIVAMVMGCVICERILRYFLVGRVKKSAPMIVTLLAVIVGTIFVVYYARNIKGAIMPHIWGILGTWENIIKNPWGYGLGTGGNVAQVLGNNPDPNVWLSTGGETALMSFMYQIGVHGVIAFSLCLLSTRLRIKEQNANMFECAFYYIPIVLLAVSLLQDNTFTPQCIVPFMLLQGGMKSCESERGKRNAKCKSNCNVSPSIS